LYGLDSGKNPPRLCKKGDKTQAFQNNNSAKGTGSSWFHNLGAEEQWGFSQNSGKFKTANVRLKKYVRKLYPCVSNHGNSRSHSVLLSRAVNGNRADPPLGISAPVRPVRPSRYRAKTDPGPDPSAAGRHGV